MMDPSHSIAFGSCNRQNKSQLFWNDIKSFEPTHFLWLGDAVYAKGKTIEKLHSAYETLTHNEYYSKFASSVSIDGVWDDHDYGINDGGKHVSEKLERQREFVDFLSSSATSTHLQSLHEQEGLYHSMNIMVGEVLVKVIFLDTRSFRDHHWVRSLGEVQVKGSALVASAFRGAYSVIGLGRSYAGEVLGETQWAWLERTLRASAEERIDAHVLVSSIQVLTTNPVFESWAHFPSEKRRLFALLQATDPRGLVLLSGDVHLGELSEARYTRADGSSGTWVEVTSSGLTHSCSDGIANALLCPLMMGMFSQHRQSFFAAHLQRNFGTITASPVAETPAQAGKREGTGAAAQWTLNFTVHDMVSLKPVLTHSVLIDHSSSAAASAFQHQVRSPITSVSLPDVPILPFFVQIFLFVVVPSVIFLSMAKLPKRRRKVAHKNM